MELLCCAQNYHWGKLGNNSAVGRLYIRNQDLHIDNKAHYAELWMGTHPNGPSLIKNKPSNDKNSQQLAHYIEENKNVLGEKLQAEFGDTLPFLFKVLSVDTALSIQVHPSKTQAEILHQTSPSLYKDPNHKPELAIALTTFKTLCGFRQLIETKTYLQSLPEMQKLINNNNLQEFYSNPNKTTLKNCFCDLMAADDSKLKEATSKLLDRLKLADNETRRHLLADLFEILHSQYPNDVGLFCIYWLNYVELVPGQSIYLPANEPHAYIQGDCVECMANSDNVIRAGLTPKFRDVATLCEMLTYISYKPTEIIFQSIQEDQQTELFKPPVKDFAVCKVTISKENKYQLIPRSSCSIVLVIDGAGTAVSDLGIVHVQQGCVLFLPACLQLAVTCSNDLLLFQAFCNV